MSINPPAAFESLLTEILKGALKGDQLRADALAKTIITRMTRDGLFVLHDDDLVTLTSEYSPEEVATIGSDQAVAQFIAGAARCIATDKLLCERKSEGLTLGVMIVAPGRGKLLKELAQAEPNLATMSPSGSA